MAGPKVRRHRILMALLPATICGPGLALEVPHLRTAASENSTIFVAEILRTQPSEGCDRVNRGHVGRCNTKVTARILRVLKTSDTQRGTPDEFETEIHQQLSGISPGGPWCGYHIEPGQQYLVLSPEKSDLRAIFRSNPYPVPVTDDEDTIADMELMIACESLGLPQQATAAAAAIARAGKPHSGYLGRYAVRLLATGSDFNTANLRQAIENSSDRAFSPAAKRSLLYNFWEEAWHTPEVPDNLLHAYVVMTARYFLDEGEIPSPPYLAGDYPPQDPRSPILQNHIPWLLSSERAKAMLRTALPLSVRRRFEAKVAELATSNRLRADEISRLRLFTASIEAR